VIGLPDRVKTQPQLRTPRVRLPDGARRLNPREPSTLKALAIVRAGRPVTAAVLRLEAEPAEP
jgi:hypothetical protein